MAQPQVGQPPLPLLGTTPVPTAHWASPSGTAVLTEWGQRDSCAAGAERSTHVHDIIVMAVPPGPVAEAAAAETCGTSTCHCSTAVELPHNLPP